MGPSPSSFPLPSIPDAEHTWKTSSTGGKKRKIRGGPSLPTVDSPTRTFAANKKLSWRRKSQTALRRPRGPHNEDHIAASYKPNTNVIKTLIRYYDLIFAAWAGKRKRKCCRERKRESPSSSLLPWVQERGRRGMKREREMSLLITARALPEYSRKRQQDSEGA